MLPLMKQELTERSLQLDDVDAIAFGAGPGSFTGIRIAAGVAQGLAYGLDVPIYAISNLKALALQGYLKDKSPVVLACTDARMGEVYWGLFKVFEDRVEEQGLRFTRYTVTALTKEQVNSPELVSLPSECLALVSNETLSGIGSGIELLDSSVLQLISKIDPNAHANADTIAFLAETAMSEGKPGELNKALPSYVRDTVTWNNLPGR